MAGSHQAGRRWGDGGGGRRFLLQARSVWVILFLAGAWIALSGAAPGPSDGDDAAPASPAPAAGDSGQSPRRAYLVPVRLPITRLADTEVQRMTDRLLAELPEEGPRPIVVFEFRAGRSGEGEGSQFERSLSLARYLTSPRLSRVETVAYLPRSVKGHAVLAVLACERIIAAPEAELGAAGIDEASIDATMRQGYEEIAERRRTIPPPVALGMLDKRLAVYKVRTLNGTQYVLADKLEELEQKGAVVDTVFREGDLGVLTGRQLVLDHHFASHLASDRAQLAAALELPPGAIREDPSLAGGWRGLRVDLRGPVTARAVNEVLRSLRKPLAQGDVNFVCLWIDSAGGSPNDSLRLANDLSDLDPSQVRTAAFIGRQARADAALAALACDEIVMTEEAVLGGPGEYQMNRVEREDLRPPLERIARAKGRDWSLLAAMADPQLEVRRYTRPETGQTRYLCREQWEQWSEQQQRDWRRGEAVETSDGLSGRRAEELGLAAHVVSGYEEFLQLYQLEGALQTAQPSRVVEAIEGLAAQPWLARTLLFIAFFALISEASAPGLGVPGFISGVCFLLFFWCQFLNGAAGWLEVLLLVGGLVAVALEIFVIPGLGIFGVGGVLMVLLSIVLASQTFVIPRNSYQFNELRGSLLTVLVGIGGAAAALAALRRFLPEAPFLRRMMLAPPDEEELEERDRREALADFDHLLGQRGVTITQLTPSGKAQFGDERVNVISDGELVPCGARVYVAEVRGNHVLVRPIEEGLRGG